jgi:deoxyribonuclease-4
MSIAGGVDRSLERGRRVGCDAIQIFTKSANQWKARPLPADEVARFRAGRSALGIWPVVAHDSYLINLASPADDLWRKSLDAFTEELERCEALDIPGLVLHPGAHLGSGEEAGLRRIAAALDEACRRLPGYKVGIWLETTAGQGSVLGHRFEQLRLVLDLVQQPERIGFCFDTCHAFVAGYELRTPAGYAATWEAFDRLLGLRRLRVIHLNDAKKGLGSHVDRHEHIGKGMLGLEAFRLLLNDCRLADRPMILETPKGEDMAEDVENLAVLRGLIERPA